MLKIFVGSTFHDLVPERNAVLAALQRMRASKFVGMEYFGSHDAGTARMSIDELDRCDIYVGVFGHRFGSGITEDEYRHARQRGLPCLLYLKADAQDAEVDPRQQRFRAEVLGAHTATFFGGSDELATVVVADLHNLMFDRLLLAGMEQLRSDYDSRIKGFLEEYLGVPGQPVAFGGREAELAALDSWLDGPAEPPYGVLVAPAGRGKSALLVHWVQGLVRRNDVSVVFFPISVRFATNRATVIFASIAARLAALHGEVVPGGVDTPVQVWRSILRSYLARRPPPGRRLLLILDGLDESADKEPAPDLFPRQPPVGLKLLVSARTLAGDVGAGGWVKRLNWERPPAARPFVLPPLTADGLARVLRTMGLPLERLSRRADVVGELFRLSSGDPLLVQLYSADLWERGEAVARLRPEDLRKITPGLGGYFERWWNDQRELWGAQSPLREPLVNDIIETLACALGPMPEPQLLALLASRSHASVWGLDDALRVLGRFVIGDGVTQGYAFSHPRLADHFFERISLAGQARDYHERYVAWAQEQLTRGGAVPVYVLQFLRAHMERAGRPVAELMMFSGRAWAEAWNPVDRGSSTGFLADVAQVRTLALRADAEAASANRPAPFLAVELRCALAAVRVRGQAADLPGPVLVALVRLGRWSAAQAVAFVQNDPDPVRRCVALLELVDAADPAQVALTLAAAGSEILSLGDEWNALVELSDAIRAIAASGHRRVALAERYLALTRSLCQLIEQLPPERRQRLIRLAAPTSSCPLPLRRRAAAMLERFGVRGVAPDAVKGLDSTEGDDQVEWDLLLALRQRFPAGAASMPAVERSTVLRLAVRVLPRCAEQSGNAEAWSVALAALAALDPDEQLREIPRLAPHLSPIEAENLLIRVLGLGNRAGMDVSLEALTARLDRGRRVRLRIKLLEAVERDRWLPRPAWLHDLFLDWPADVVDESLVRFARLLPADRLVELLARLAASAAERIDWAAPLSICLSSLVADAISEDVRVVAIACIGDQVAPRGHADSLEEWRSRAVEPQLTAGLRRTLSAASPDPALLIATRARLAQSLKGTRPALSRMVDAGRCRLNEADSGGGPNSLPHTLPDHGDLAEATLLWCMSRSGHDDGEDPTIGLGDRILATAGESPLDCFQLLETIAPWLDDGDKNDAIAVLCGQSIRFDQVASGGVFDWVVPVMRLLAREPLFPPSADVLGALGDWMATLLRGLRPDGVEILRARLQALPMPDLLREEWLFQALAHAVEFESKAHGGDAGEFATYALLESVTRLSAPAPRLVSLALASLARPGNDSLLVELTWLLEHVHLPRWLRIMMDRDAPTRHAGLAALAACGRFGNDTAMWRAVLQALRVVGDDVLGSRWLVFLAPHLPGAVLGDARDLLRGIRDSERRYDALCMLVPVMPEPDARELLLEALGIAERGIGHPAMARGLVQWALEMHPGDAEVMERVLGATAQLPDRELRADAFAEMATTLTEENLMQALVRLQAADDDAARVIAALNLMDDVVDPMRRPKATRRALDLALSMRDGAAKCEALIRVAARLPASERGPVVATALAMSHNVPPGAERASTLAALAEVLRDAPFAVIEQGVAWLRGLPPDRDREAAIERLLPGLPAVLHRRVIDLLGQWALIRVAPWLGEEDLTRAVSVRGEIADRAWYRRALRESAESLSRVERRADLTWSPVPVARFFGKGLETLAWVDEHALLEDMPALGRAQLIRAAASLNDPLLRARAGALLAVHVRGDGRGGALGDAVAAAQAIVPPLARAVALTRLAAQATGAPREACRAALPSALRAALDEPDLVGAGRAVAAAAGVLPWVTLLDCLRSAGRDEATAAAWCQVAVGAEARNDETLWALAASIVEPAILTLAILRAAPALSKHSAGVVLGLAARVPVDTLRAQALTALVPRLPDVGLPGAAGIVDGIDIDFAWLDALCALAERWPVVLTAERLERASRYLSGIGHEEYAGECLVRLAAACPPTGALILARAAERADSAGHRSEAFSLLLAGSPGLAVEAPRWANTIGDDFHRAVLLGHVASLERDVPVVDPAEAIAAMRKLGQRRFRDALVLAVLRARRLSDTMFEATCEVRLPDSATLAIVPWLTSEQAMVVARRQTCFHPWHWPTIPPERRRWRLANAGLLALALVEVLEPSVRDVLIDAIRRARSRRLLAQVLSDLAPGWNTPELMARALGSALRMRRSAFRVEAVAGLMIALNSEQQQAAFADLLAHQVPSAMAREIERVLPLLPPSLAGPLEDLVGQIADPVQAGVLRGAFARWRAAWMPEPVPIESNDPELEALLAALVRDAASSHFEPTAEFGRPAVRAAPDTLYAWSESLRRARRASISARANWLQAHAERLPEALHGQALELAWDMPLGAELRRAHAALLPVLGPAHRPELHRIWAETVAELAVLRRLDVLAALPSLVPLMRHLGKSDVIAEVIEEILD